MAALLKNLKLRDEAAEIARQLKEAHQQGIPWGDMAVLYDHWAPDGQAVNRAMNSAGIPFKWNKNVRFGMEYDEVKLLTAHSCKGLEFPLVAIMGGRIVEQAKTDADAAKLLYVAMTRATSQLIMTTGEDGLTS